MSRFSVTFYERGTFMKKIISAILVFIFGIFLFSCGENGRRENSVKALSEVLRTSYESEVKFNILQDGETLAGSTILTRDGASLRLDVAAPESLSGMSIEYDAVGAPSSVAVHFAGIDTTLPTAAISRINVLACLAAGDFPEILAHVSGENITEYEYGENLYGYCARLKYGEADVAVCYSEDGTVPYSIEYSDGDLYGTFTFVKFKSYISGKED